MNSIKNNPSLNRQYSSIERTRSMLTLALSLACLTPFKAKAGEKVLETEVAVRFAPQGCNPYKKQDGSLQLARNVQYDSHGHPVASDQTKSENCQTHPKWTGAFSYLYAHEFQKAEAHHDKYVDGDFVSYDEHGENEEGLHEAEGDHSMHPTHRIRAQVIRALLENKLEIGPSLELGIPRRREGPFQLGVGTFFAIHPRKHHELSAMGRMRFSLQTNQNNPSISSWETGVFYSATLYKPLALGVTLLAEGHGHEVHWGAGPTMGLRFKRFSLNAELAIGLGDQEGPWIHSHLVGIFYLGGAKGHSH